MEKHEIEKQLKYLEEERKKLWERIVEHDKEIDQKTSDIEKEAKQASKKTSEFKNRSEEAKLKIDECYKAILVLQNDIKNYHKSVKELSDKINTYHNKSLENYTKSDEYLSKLKNNLDTYHNNINELDSIFEGFSELTNKINSLNEIKVNADDFLSKIDALYKNTISRKREIDTLHREIIGYDETDEVSGLVTHIDGIKDELATSYEEIKNDLEELNSTVNETKEKLVTDYNNLYLQANNEFKENLDSWENKYTDLEKRITDLLPNAVSAGLSHAYHDKKEDEIFESKRHNKKFEIALGGLVLVSLIPFGVASHSLYNKVELIEVIYRMPRIVLSILPLYIPVLWLAYSSSKKLNLSKRLIEEYTHKEVLSKTYEGLSKQINNLEDSEISRDLKNKLLYNVLEISSENPGKLISDYNKSDHPLMDALDKSVQLANSVEKLSKLPGIQKLTSVIDKKAKDLLTENDKKANEGLNKLDKNNGTDNAQNND